LNGRRSENEFTVFAKREVKSTTKGETKAFGKNEGSEKVWQGRVSMLYPKVLGFD